MKCLSNNERTSRVSTTIAAPDLHSKICSVIAISQVPLTVNIPANVVNKFKMCISFKKHLTG